ncbi:MAG: alkaline phosphatase family protein [Candidatus Aminicenantes bacterium]|nr:MAG: alkaline phosphatase family protein [Candidatus Aminicenantes bacterium]
MLRILIAAGLAVLTIGSASAQTAERPVRLVLQITVDQLRSDLIDRYSAGYGEGGFRRLLDEGAFFVDAHHRHANTETVVGHTTLATGTDPAVHGMVANVWLDRATGKLMYNVEDADQPLLGDGGGVDASTEIDPTQKLATTQGRSPRAIRTTTIGDEIALSIGPEAKVFGISVKDRGAITMAGHAGTAYWFSKSDGRMVTSTFYKDAYPDWVDVWNDRGVPASYADKSWELLAEPAAYLFGKADDQAWEVDFPGYGRIFPHPFGPADGKYFTTLLTLSPAGDEITLDFAKTLMAAENIGADEVTDYLSISFSSTDYVGHFFGASSLESEDNLHRLDRTLAALFSYVDETVGLDRTLVVLSADHGASEAPDYLNSLGIGGSYFNFDDIDTTDAIAALKAEFGVAEELVDQFFQPYLYLNREAIAARGLDFSMVSRRVAEELRDFPGIAYAVSSDDLRAGAVAQTPVTEAVLANFNEDRSGDIYVVFEPHWFVADFDGKSVTGSHGSPWAYDTHVPVIWMGPGVEAGRIARRVETVDVAPTIAAYLGVRHPSGTRGRVMTEVTD